MNFHSEMPPEARGKAAGKSTGRLGALGPFESARSLLALDLGTRTGWALALGPFDGGEPRTWCSGVQDFKGGRYEGGGMRFLRFRSWLTDMKATSSVDAVVFEEVRRHRGTDAAHVYGGLLAILTSWCEHHGIPYIGLGVSAIKRHATGRGNASKLDMIEAAAKRGPCRQVTNDDNQADAVCILNCALEGAGV